MLKFLAMFLVFLWGGTFMLSRSRNRATHRFATYDIFDTVMTRMVGDPKSVFLLTGSVSRCQGLIQHDPVVFANARVESEKACFRNLNQGFEEVALTEIYRELEWRLGLDKNTAKECCKIELQLEEFLCRPVRSALEELVRERSRGIEISFISDMYLEEGFIKRLLEKCGILAEGESVFVSSSAGVSKRSGRLFAHVSKVKGVEFDSWTHTGDHVRSDVAAPRRLGIRSVHALWCTLNPYETLLESFSHRTAGISSLFAGTSRYVRLNFHDENPHDRALTSVTAGVVAPTLVSYVLWVLQDAKKRGLKRLYFVSRDGFVLKLIADCVEQKLKTGIEFRYLYGSRQAWHRASVRSDDDIFNASWLSVKTHSEIGVADILERLGVTSEESKSLLHDHASAAFGGESDVAIVKKLLDFEDVRNLIFGRCASARKEAVSYLQQEGCFDSTPWAMVDVGWRARPQFSLGKILNLQRPVEGYYFGLRENAVSDNTSISRAFLFDGRNRLGRSPEFEQFDVVIEMFCQAAHPMTIGYQKIDDVVSPIFRDEDVDPRNNWGVGKIHEVLKQFIDALPIDLLNSHADLRPMVSAVLSEFWDNASSEEAQCWGQFPIESDQTKQVSVPLATPLTLRDCFGVCLKGRVKQNQFNWPHGTNMRTSAALLRVIEVKRKMRRKASFVRAKFAKLFSLFNAFDSQSERH